MEYYDVVVVGGGQAGLGTSYVLKKHGLNHILFETGLVGETWRSQRWDSFAVNTPNSFNQLPGDPYQGDFPDGFLLRDELVNYFQSYSEKFDLPINTGVTVTSVIKDGEIFVLETANNQGELKKVKTKNIVVASGYMQKPSFPKLMKLVPDHVTQLHAGTYRNPEEISQGGVVVVGGGQSGVQIAEELAVAGKEVYLCSSKAGRLPRRYRGKEIMFWWEEIGYWDEVKADDLNKHAAITTGVSPIVSGVGPMGHTISFQSLAKKGVKIVGRLIGIENKELIFDNSTKDNIKFGDLASEQYKKAVDDYLSENGIEPPPLESDPSDFPDPNGESASEIDRLNFEDADVNTIIWATGFKGNFEWLNLPVFDEDGIPIHSLGISPVDGVYFIGFPWISKRRSGIIGGIEDDANTIVANIIQNN